MLGAADAPEVLFLLRFEVLLQGSVVGIGDVTAWLGVDRRQDYFVIPTVGKLGTSSRVHV